MRNLIDNIVDRAIELCETEDTYRYLGRPPVAMDAKRAWKQAVLEKVNHLGVAVEVVRLLALSTDRRSTISYWKGGEGQDFITVAQGLLIESDGPFIERIIKGVPNYDELTREREELLRATRGITPVH